MIAPERAGAKRHLDVQTTAEALLAHLKRNGTQYFFVNAGTDFASVVEAYARLDESGLDFPTPIVATHENLAVGMAHGFYLIARTPQAVMCHVSVGSANAVCAIMNASRDQIPIIFLSGRTPLFESGKFGSRNGDIHWPQEMFDQGGLMREVVKWDYELRDGLNVEQVVDRAYGIAQAAPPGPIYLMLPREVLAGKLDGADVRAEVPAVPAPPFPSPEHVATIARRIATAEFPVIVTSASGADAATVAPLAALCERFGIAHVDRKARFVNLPTGHPLHLVQPLEDLFEDIDALLFLETDVPWIPNRGNPRPDSFIADAGTDPLFGRIPIRSFPADVSLTTTVAALLPELERALEAAGAEQSAAARRARIAAAGERGRATLAERVAADAERGGPITKLFLSTRPRCGAEQRRHRGQRVLRALRLHAVRRARDVVSQPAGGGLGLGFSGGARREARGTRAHGDLGARRRRLYLRQPGRLPSRDRDARPAVAHDRLQQRALGGRAELRARHVRQGYGARQTPHGAALVAGADSRLRKICRSVGRNRPARHRT